eukprot:11182796-Lingulodinium_polyedra.AAC.1
MAPPRRVAVLIPRTPTALHDLRVDPLAPCSLWRAPQTRPLTCNPPRAMRARGIITAANWRAQL